MLSSLGVYTLNPDSTKLGEPQYYGDDASGRWEGPMTLAALDELRKTGKIQDYTSVSTPKILRQQGEGGRGIPYHLIPRLTVEFEPGLDAFRTAREGKPTTVLSGPNNSGKTLLLKQLFLEFGQGSYLVACNRFSHVDVLNTRKIEEYEYRRFYDNYSG